ncbi:MAG TPA: RHS repeat-associated core domain-containing protein [Chloroflexota bacterium]|nr:RHS repeat-associated core domain-containing protein [Chloroflexota bacterium]
MFQAHWRGTRTARGFALLAAVTFAWSFILAAPAQAMAQMALHPAPIPGLRKLSDAETKRIAGSISGHVATVTAGSGAAFPWQGGGGDFNASNGNKQTAIPIVSWTQRGGMPISLALVHNSASGHDSELGWKFTHSYDIYLMASGLGGDLAVHWGDDQSYVFTYSGGVYSAPAGIHDTLVKNIDNTYTLTKPDQTAYHFTTGLYCDTISDENGNSVTLGYATGNFLNSITDATGRSISLTFTSGRITSITDPLSRTWSLSYNGNGELQTITYPVLGSTYYTTGLSYDSNHNITDLKDRRGNDWLFGYSGNALTSEKDPAGNETDYSYGTSTTTVTDPNGNATVDTFTSGKLTSVEDATSQTEHYVWDSNNNRTQLTTKRGYSWNFTFDSAGNMLTSEDPYSKVVTDTFSSHNRLLTRTVPTGEETDYSYDSSDNLTGVTFKDSLGTTQASVSYTIGTHGIVTDYYDANSHHYQYGHNSNGELTSVITPLGNETDFTVDGLGVRTGRTDAMSRSTSYSLDAWERCTTVTYPDSSTHTFTFDPDNLVTQFVDGTGTTNRTYDACGRILTEKLGTTTTASYTYDGTGQLGLLSTVTDVNSRTLTYSYTARNELSEVSETAGTTDYTHDEDGNTTAISNPNGTTVARVFDHADRLTSVTNKNSGGTTLSSFDYTLDDDGRRDYVVEADGSTVSYGYDWGGRLTGETRTGTNAFTASYTLDPVGNRTSQTIGTATTSFTLDNDDELTATSSSTGGFVNSYSYNANGEQTGRTLSGTAYTLAYDYDGQMTSAAVGGATTSFAYDASGRRVTRTAGGTTTRFYYNGGGILAEKQGSTTTAVYTYGEGLIRKDSEVPLFDGLGSERTVTNGSQTVTGTLNLDAFGNQVGSTGSSSSPYTFAATSGYRNDGDAGLTHVGARYYDAQVGRFITRDTDLSERPYLYCNHDPVNAVDPSGHGSGGPHYKGDPYWSRPKDTYSADLDFGFNDGDMKLIGHGTDNWGDGLINAGGKIWMAGAVGTFGTGLIGRTGGLIGKPVQAIGGTLWLVGHFIKGIAWLELHPFL